jgi:hypothetical protein
METSETHSVDEKTVRQPIFASDLTRQEEDAAMIALVTEQVRLKNAVSGGASWFFWIAGLLIVNTVLFFSGSEWAFVSGLDITTLIAAYAMIFMENAFVPALFANLVIAGVFGLFGYIARKPGNSWAFIAGMTLYVLDALLAVWLESWISLAFHVLALFFLFGGLRAANALMQVERRIAALDHDPIMGHQYSYRVRRVKRDW